MHLIFSDIQYICDFWQFPSHCFVFHFSFQSTLHLCPLPYNMFLQNMFLLLGPGSDIRSINSGFTIMPDIVLPVKVKQCSSLLVCIDVLSLCTKLIIGRPSRHPVSL